MWSDPKMLTDFPCDLEMALLAVKYLAHPKHVTQAPVHRFLKTIGRRFSPRTKLKLLKGRAAFRGT